MSLPHYQDRLAELFKLTRIYTVVETGCSTEGVSAQYILKAMDAQGFGELHSVEATCPQPFKHPRFHFWPGFSQDVLPRIAYRPWDMFLHDSDHEYECQTFEYNYAWDAVRSGGIIITDDPYWGTHNAWKKFLEKHGVQERELGYARYFIKP